MTDVAAIDAMEKGESAAVAAAEAPDVKPPLSPSQSGLSSDSQTGLRTLVGEFLTT
jgi:hypothetical protein